MSRHAALGLLFLAFAFVATSASAELPTGGIRVLFVGNSYTRFNNLPLMFRKLAEAGGVAARSDGASRSGAQLRTHWTSGDARTRIRTGHYTHVILQDHSLAPIRYPERVEQYVRRFHGEIERTGARTVLYETWARHPRSRLYRSGAIGSTPREMLGRIHGVLSAIAMSEGDEIAPVGTAWEIAIATHPEITLYRRDGTHPTPEGTYLAACVMYGVIVNASPVGLAYRPWPMSAATASALQQVAADALRHEAPLGTAPTSP